MSIVILILGFNYLKGKELFNDTVKLHAVYTNIDGINKSNPVFYYGVKVGKVDDIILQYEEEKLKITLDFSVSPEIMIPKGAIAKIVSADLMGSKAIKAHNRDLTSRYIPTQLPLRL